ncbi:MAG: cyclic nucleotide-binding domain-containing protein [Gammaproteobacteria bacterium]|nr:cyclic nucleotide-binding domain-containing protein [Gammaproteobacteria bacterium]
MTSKVIETLLEQDDFLQGRDWHRRSYTAGSVIFNMGDESNNVYLILKGQVQATGSAQTSDGKELKPSFKTFYEGEIFGEMVLFDQLPRSAMVSTVLDTEVAEIDGAALLEFMEQHPEQGYRILSYIVSSLVSRLRDTNEKLFSVYSWGLKAHGIDKHL